MEPLNLPITGICSFGKYPICTDLDKLDADIAVLGVPCDFGVGFMSGARLAPRRIREASTQYGRGTGGYYDFENDVQRLAAPFSIADCGDVDILHSDFNYTFNNVTESVKKNYSKGSCAFCNRRRPLHLHSGGKSPGRSRGGDMRSAV